MNTQYTYYMNNLFAYRYLCAYKNMSFWDKIHNI